jgi:hypothetical protein
MASVVGVFNVGCGGELFISWVSFQHTKFFGNDS